MKLKIEHNKPDVVVIDKDEKICYAVDIACPTYQAISEIIPETQLITWPTPADAAYV